MPQGLVRYQKEGHLHFVTFSCYERRPYLGTPAARDIFVRSLEVMRARYRFFVIAYVVMPEHVHLLMTEPLEVPLAKALQALKLSVAVQNKERPFWHKRYYDFNVFSERKSLRNGATSPQPGHTRSGGIACVVGMVEFSALDDGCGRPGRSGVTLDGAEAWWSADEDRPRHRHPANPRLRSETWGTRPSRYV